MRLFLYEYITGGGLLLDAPRQPLTGSLLQEGTAMLAALAEDVLQAGHEVVVLRDPRLGSWRPPATRIETCQTLHDVPRLAASCDAAILIAPELENALFKIASLLPATFNAVASNQPADRLLSPGLEFIELASSKSKTVARLRSAGVPTPKTFCQQDPPAPSDFPLVAKPDWGAGSENVRLLRNLAEYRQATATDQRIHLESFCAGMPASVAVLCGPQENVPLPACEQLLSNDGQFRYLGGRLPLASALADRAKNLALAALRALPEARGYVGIDLVLGEEEKDDAVIEVNPRLTTSYVGLRRALPFNLAEQMIKIALGEPVKIKACSPIHPVEFRVCHREEQ